MPVKEGYFSYVNLLQYYSQLPFEVKPEFREITIAFLNAINEKTSIGYFGLTNDGNVFQRYIFSIRKNEIVDKEVFIETFGLLMFVQEIFSVEIEAVSTGAKTIEEALNSLSL